MEVAIILRSFSFMNKGETITSMFKLFKLEFNSKLQMINDRDVRITMYYLIKVIKGYIEENYKTLNMSKALLSNANISMNHVPNIVLKIM